MNAVIIIPWPMFYVALCFLASMHQSAIVAPGGTRPPLHGGAWGAPPGLSAGMGDPGSLWGSVGLWAHLVGFLDQVDVVELQDDGEVDGLLAHSPGLLVEVHLQQHLGAEHHQHTLYIMYIYIYL